jgi:gliding motility-associated protein GldM
MSLPKEPRQKMITIMYLVLTALLALNVSKQIVHAFIVVNTGLQLTNENTQGQTTALHAKFEKAYANDPIKTKPFNDAAKLVSEKANKMVSDIQDLKAKLVKDVDHKPWDLDKKDTMMEYVDAKEDFTTPTGILLGDGDDVTKGKAHALKLELNTFRKDLINIFKNPQLHTTLADTARVKLGLLTPDIKVPDEGKQTWEYYYFGETPLVSDVVTFTELQSDVRNAEAAMLNYLYSNIDATSFKVTDFLAKVIPSSSYVLLGDSFRADIFPSAFIATQQPTITIGEVDTVKKEIKGTGEVVKKFDNNGIGKYSFKTEKEGPAVITGVIQMKDPTGAIKNYPFKTSYIVAKAAVVVSPTQMNVFYAGIPNPVDVSAAGIDASALHPSMSMGSISPSGAKGHYNVNASADAIGKEATVTVSATMPDGTHKPLPPVKFRIKRIPDPSCFTGGKSGDVSMSKIQLQAVPKVEARMPADFDFGGVNFTVISFAMAIGVNGVFVDDRATGGRLTPKMLSLIGQAPKGGYIIVKDVQVKGPDGKTRTIQGMAIRLN